LDNIGAAPPSSFHVLMEKSIICASLSRNDMPEMMDPMASGWVSARAKLLQSIATARSVHIHPNILFFIA
jgi:hypothetical protein